VEPEVEPEEELLFEELPHALSAPAAASVSANAPSNRSFLCT
jgi:hypothetical protein